MIIQGVFVSLWVYAEKFRSQTHRGVKNALKSAENQADWVSVKKCRNQTLTLEDMRVLRGEIAL